jgi:hypothetical protein
LRGAGLGYDCQVESGPGSRDPLKQETLEAVRRWFYYDWRRIENKLRTSLVEGISVFLSLFDDNPWVKRTFCPPEECYDPKLNADGRYGHPLPPFEELIEQGKVCALNFPAGVNSGLAKAVGCMMKLDFQRAVINRTPKMKAEPSRYWRQVFFICDEYHEFATAGQNDPNGDEKFLALSRQPRCIPIVATQSVCPPVGGSIVPETSTCFYAESTTCVNFLERKCFERWRSDTAAIPLRPIPPEFSVCRVSTIRNTNRIFRSSSAARRRRIRSTPPTTSQCPARSNLARMRRRLPLQPCGRLPPLA